MVRVHTVLNTLHKCLKYTVLSTSIKYHSSHIYSPIKVQHRKTNTTYTYKYQKKNHREKREKIQSLNNNKYNSVVKLQLMNIIYQQYFIVYPNNVLFIIIVFFNF